MPFPGASIPEYRASAPKPAAANCPPTPPPPSDPPAAMEVSMSLADSHSRWPGRMDGIVLRPDFDG